MSDSLYERAGDIFLRAMELEGAARDEFLGQACAGDEALAAMVAKLVGGDDPDTNPLDQGLPPIPETGLHTGPWQTPTEIGPYRVVNEIGQGGMGRIYLAERADDEFRKKVAIKVVHPGLGSEEILLRFKSERQILANLDHPNIARLLDGGSLPDGRPYLVMEYVDGQRIDQYCDSRELSVEDRLALFCTVCSAVQVAHQSLVVHRDLKPSNIFVTTDGAPKLLDFGIAKLLEPERADFTVAHTRTDEALLTPEYASPEQLSGLAITTASDVYSLGVILYGLLTGHPPYRFTERTPLAIHRAICEEDPTRPSAQVQDGLESSTGPRTAADLARARGSKPERLRRRISGDLDNIVLTALRKEPQRRYASAEQLAGDIQRHLKGLPVSARPDTWRYRTGKFFRRNRIAVSASLVLFLSLIAFGISTALQSKGLERQRNKAEAEATKAAFEAETYESVADFLVRLFEGANPREAGRSQTTARDLLDRGSRRIEELADRPAIQARLLDTIGRSYQFLGANDQAEPLLVRAVGLCEELYGPDSVETAEPLHRVAKLRFDAGDVNTSLALYERILAIHLAHQPGNDAKVAESHNNITLPLGALGRSQEAVEHLKEALRVHRRVPGPQHEPLAMIQANLGATLYGLGRVDEGLATLEAAVDEAMHLPEDHVARMLTLSIMADCIKDVGRHEEAVRMLEKLRTQSEKSYGTESDTYVDIMLHLAVAKKYTGEFAEAIELLYEVIEIQRERAIELELSKTLTILADDLRAEGLYDDAEELAYEALEIRQRLLPGSSLQCADTLAVIGVIETRRGDFEAADATMTEVLGILDALNPAPSNGYLVVLERVADYRRRSGSTAEALEILGRALTMRLELFGERHWSIAAAKQRMAACHEDLGNLDVAEALYREALVLHESGLTGSAEYAYGASRMGRLLFFRMARPGEAEAYLRTTYDLRSSGPNATEVLMSAAALDLVECLLQLERDAEAAEILTRLQLDFPDLANGPLNHSQRFRNVDRALAERRGGVGTSGSGN